MKIKCMKDVDAFRQAIKQCQGNVWLESVYGDRYNLKSALSQYVAIADLLRDKTGELELSAALPEDQEILQRFLDTLES
jgi:hypothetical protein